MVKASRYMEGEVQRLAGNLSRLAAGNLDFDTNIAPADRYTEDVRRSFVKIMESLTSVRDRLGAMIEDAELLEQAAQDGRLQVRADATRHEGEFRTIIEGLNATLDAVVTPLTEANGVLQRMAVNDYTVRMTGQYQGTYAEVATAINRVIDQVNRVADVFDGSVMVTSPTAKRLRKSAAVLSRIGLPRPVCALWRPSIPWLPRLRC